MRRTGAAVIGVALALASCTDVPAPPPEEPTPSLTATSAETSPATTSSEEPTTATPTTPGETNDTHTATDEAPSPTATEPDDVESVHAWLTAPSSQGPPSQPPDTAQEITGVRVGAHDGYDRIVLELSGADPTLGWFAGYTEEAIEDPTGDPLDVEGDAFLQLGVNGIDWANESPERYSGDTVPGEGLEVVTEVVFGGLFEAQQQIVIGLDEETAYRVFALSDPARIVIDVQHD